jgi:DNA-binding SARP family transcriptional activator/pimeloyl-ACP methyl ester carboxylesterase
VEIRILGPLEIVAQSGPIDVPSGKARLLLAALVVHANQVVSTDRLFECLWRGEPPISAVNTLQTYVSHLRHSLEPDRSPRTQGRMVITREPGYVLAVDPDRIDAPRFERLVGEARLVLSSAPDRAAALLRTALSLWRGEPLADFTFEPFAQSEITRLTELRLTALEDRVEAELALGGHAALCGELAQLVREHPLRERLAGQQMVALYRCGRQADALRAYAYLRETLVEQLGIDPSPALVRLEEAILCQEPELDWPVTAKRAAPVWVPVGTMTKVTTDRLGQDILDPAHSALGGCRRPDPVNLFSVAAEQAAVGGADLHAVAEAAFSRERPDGSHLPHQHIDQDIRYCISPDGVCVAYAVAGHGPPLVKAANWLTHLRLEWESPIWSHRLHDLARRRRLIRYDERGCGLSDWDVATFNFDAWVDDLELVVDAAGVEQFPLLGLSQGGAVAIAYAVRHPEQVSHLILFGAYCRGRMVRAASPQARAEAALDLDIARIGWRRDDDTFRQVYASQFLPDGTRELWDAFNNLQRATTSIDNVVRFLDVFARVDVSRLAPNVRCPTLVLHSRGDLRVPESQAREIAELIPNSRLVLLNSRNHVLLAHEPAWQVFLAEVDHFLAA